MQDFWKNLDAGYYDKILTSGLEQNRGLQAGWHNITFTTITSKIGKNKNHLDYACGPGTLIGKFSENNSVGVDISSKQIIYAQKKYGDKGEFFELEGFKVDQYKNYFEIITVLGLIEFIDNKDFVSLIKDLKRMLKPNGSIYLTTPNFKAGMKILNLILNFISNVSYSSIFVSKYNKRNLKELLDRNEIKNYSIQKFLNMGFIFSIFNLKLGLWVNNLISTITFYRFGFLILLKIKND